MCCICATSVTPPSGTSYALSGQVEIRGDVIENFTGSIHSRLLPMRLLPFAPFAYFPQPELREQAIRSHPLLSRPRSFTT